MLVARSVAGGTVYGIAANLAIAALPVAHWTIDPGRPTSSRPKRPELDSLGAAVRHGDTLPYWAPAGQLFAVNNCSGLYLSTGNRHEGRARASRSSTTPGCRSSRARASPRPSASPSTGGQHLTQPVHPDELRRRPLVLQAGRPELGPPAPRELGHHHQLAAGHGMRLSPINYIARAVPDHGDHRSRTSIRCGHLVRREACSPTTWPEQVRPWCSHSDLAAGSRAPVVTVASLPTPAKSLALCRASGAAVDPGDCRRGQRPVGSTLPRRRPPAGRFSCVVDDHPRFHLDALRWFATLTEAGRRRPRPTWSSTWSGPTRPRPLDYLRARGVAIRTVEPSIPALPTATRSRRPAPGRGPWTASAVLCDTDLAVLEDPRRD